MRFIRHCGSAELQAFGEGEIKSFLTELAVEGNVAVDEIWELGIGNWEASPKIARASARVYGVFQNSLARAVKAAGIAKRVTPRTIRHSFATHLLENSMRVDGTQISA